MTPGLERRGRAAGRRRKMAPPRTHPEAREREIWRGSTSNTKRDTWRVCSWRT